jgi:YVTN family beta-propeller protein
MVKKNVCKFLLLFSIAVMIIFSGCASKDDQNSSNIKGSDKTASAAQTLSIAPTTVGAKPLNSTKIEPLLYVTNSGSDNISIINTTTDVVVSTIKAGENPSCIASNPNGSRIYVTNGKDSDVYVIDTMTNAVISIIRVGSDPFAVASSPDGKKVYVANRDSDSVSVINASTNKVTNTVRVGSEPQWVAVSPDGKSLYVSNFRYSVSVIDTATYIVTAMIPTNNTPDGIVASQDGKRIFVVNGNVGTVFLINASTNTIYNKIKVDRLNIWNRGIAIAPNGKKIYLTGSNLSVIDTENESKVSDIPVECPGGIVAFTSDGEKAYVTNYFESKVSVIDAENNVLLHTIEVGMKPSGLALAGRK